MLPKACMLALLLPLLMASGFLLWLAAAEQTGAAPLLLPRPANVAEAAATGSAADVLRFLRAGDDPRRVHPLRPDVISSAVLAATAPEAAIWSRQLEMVQLLEREGAIAASDRAPLACLAADVKADDIAEYLAPDRSATCRPGEALASVAGRTSMGAVQ